MKHRRGAIPNREELIRAIERQVTVARAVEIGSYLDPLRWAADALINNICTPEATALTAEGLRQGLDPFTLKEIVFHLCSCDGYDDENYFDSLRLDTVTDRETKERWLRNKIRREGAPNEETVRHIAKQGVIRRPVIFDVPADQPFEGRHRLAAALLADLPVPVVYLESKK